MSVPELGLITRLPIVSCYMPGVFVWLGAPIMLIDTLHGQTGGL